MFVESPEAAAPTKKLRKGLSKVFGRKDSDSDAETECIDGASGVGDTEEALDGHLFSVGVAFAQVIPACNSLTSSLACPPHSLVHSDSNSTAINLFNCGCNSLTAVTSRCNDALGVTSTIHAHFTFC